MCAVDNDAIVSLPAVHRLPVGRYIKFQVSGT
jgi:hypothetical protein